MSWQYETVEVDLWTVLMAIRYGTGRLTYADTDAADLAHKYWDRFPIDIQNQIREDALRTRGTGAPMTHWSWIGVQ